VNVILVPDWFCRRTQIAVKPKKLAAFRPATIDRIPTKMAWWTSASDLHKSTLAAWVASAEMNLV
jgi:hypothetical protein